MWVKVRKRVKRYTYTGCWLEGTMQRSWHYEWQDWYRWEGKQYVKKPSHKKKVKSQKQKNKEAWREEKQVKRDKAKRQDLHGYRSDGCPVWLKRHCNKKHRQWEKRMIEREQYDKLGTWNWKRKDIFDPWMWD